MLRAGCCEARLACSGHGVTACSTISNDIERLQVTEAALSLFGAFCGGAQHKAVDGWGGMGRGFARMQIGEA